MASIGKFISFVLRHHPESIGITLDEQGWASTNAFLNGMQEKGYQIDKALLKQIVAEDNKGRYRFNEDETKIRASQGHSISVDLGLSAKTPPDVLYHGTGTKSVESILVNGILKKSRQYVHLSDNVSTATTVGARHGVSVILKVDAKKMQEDGLKFYLSENQVWLTDFVAPDYIEIIH